MAILNYTTSVDARKTVSEIQEKLSKRGAKRIIVDYDDRNNPVSISFSIIWNGNTVFYELPCNPEGVLNAMVNAKDVGPKWCNKDQAFRVAWRIVKDWIEAQMAIVEAEFASIPEVFLP